MLTDEDEMVYRKAMPMLIGEYWYVSMDGGCRYPFPTLQAATRFAQTHAQRFPGRSITIDYPDGRRWDGKAWVA